MTGRRASGQQLRQRRLLNALATARHDSPTQGTGGLEIGEVPMLAFLASIEAAASIARLGRLSADPAADDHWRTLIVISNAVARSVVDDLVSGDRQATERLYRAVTAMQKGTL